MNNSSEDLIVNLGLCNREDLEFVCIRRNDGIVFLDKNKDVYIKIGNQFVLKKEYEIQKKFMDLKFQVAKILSSFEEGDKFVYTEESLGEKVIGKDINEGNITYEEGFQRIYKVAENYFRQQSETMKGGGCSDTILKKNNIGLLDLENLVDKQTYYSLLDKLHGDLSDCIDFGLTHGDFNSMNLFKNGIIDLEDSYDGPLGFDLVTLISHHYWFQINGSKNRSMLFSFERKDIERLISMHNKTFSISTLKNFDLCFMLRSVWSTVGMEKFPEEQEFRLNRLNIYIENYLKGESLLEIFLREVDKVNDIIFKKNNTSV